MKPSKAQCSNCGETFYRRHAKIMETLNKGMKLYCSPACRSKGQNTQIEMPCTHCGTPVTRRASGMVTGHVFCSTSCSAFHANMQRSLRLKGSEDSKAVEVSAYRQRLEETRRNEKEKVLEAAKQLPDSPTLDIQARKTRGRRTWTENQLRQAVSESVSFAGVLKKLGLTRYAGNHTTVKRYCTENGIDTSHFTGQGHNSKPPSVKSAKPLVELLVPNSNLRSANLKKRLYDTGLKNRICELCGQDEVWQGKKMSLRLDHINGDPTDNRLVNLRIVCPNCDATLPTFCRGALSTCPGCGMPKLLQQDFCDLCKSTHTMAERPVSSLRRPRKVERPTQQKLRDLLDKNGYEAIGRMYGVSGAAVKKWLRMYERYGSSF